MCWLTSAVRMPTLISTSMTVRLKIIAMRSLCSPMIRCVPIRLMQTPTTYGVRPFAGIERGVGWCLSATRDAKQ